MRKLSPIFLLAILIPLLSCKSVPEIVPELTVEDLNWVAEQTINQLLASGCLNSSNGKRYVIVFHSDEDKPSQGFSAEQIYLRKIRIAILNSGKAIIYTPNLPSSSQEPALKPDIAISTEISTFPNAKAGYYEFTFHLTINEILTNRLVWETSVCLQKKA